MFECSGFRGDLRVARRPLWGPGLRVGEPEMRAERAFHNRYEFDLAMRDIHEWPGRRERSLPPIPAVAAAPSAFSRPRRVSRASLWSVPRCERRGACL